MIPLQSIDYYLSFPLFVSIFPNVIECALSIPGNLFGLPIFTLVIFPNLFATLTLEFHPYPTSSFWHFTIWSISIAGLILWYHALKGNVSAIRFLYGPVTGAGSAFFGIFLLSCIPGKFEPSRSVGHVCIVNWCISVIPVALLKPAIARQRPVMLKNSDIQISRNKKHLSILPRLFRKDGSASFPSGDAAGAMAIAYTINQCYDVSAWLIFPVLLLSGIGRIYWQAHYLFDVLIGMALAYCFIFLFGPSLSTSPSKGSHWWEAIVAHLVLCSTAVASRIYWKANVLSSGTIEIGRLSTVKEPLKTAE
jgi:membrane-associated phospholipid phosphatase